MAKCVRNGVELFQSQTNIFFIAESDSIDATSFIYKMILFLDTYFIF